MNRQRIISFLRGVSLVGIYGGLLVPLMFIPVVIFPFVFSKLIYFQVLIGLTFPAYLALAWMEPKYRPRHHWLYGAIAAYMLAIGLSVVFAADPLRSWWGNQERMNGMFTLLHFFAWLTMVVGLLHRWDSWRRLLNFQVGLSAFMAFVAMLQKGNPMLFGFQAGPRVGGLVDNPIYMAAYQIFNLFFLGLLFLKTPSRNARIVYAGIALMDIVAFTLAQSRGALVGLGVGLVVFALFYGLFTPNKKVRFGILAGVVTLFLSYGLLFAFRDTPWIKDGSLGRFTNFSGSITTRLIAWDIAWKGFLERPLTGWGFDNFHILFNSHYNPQSLRFGIYETWFDRSHNTILDVLSMTGLFGILTFGAIYIALFVSVWSAYRKKWIDLPIASILIALPVAYFIQNLFVFDHPAAFTMSYLLFAIVIAATRGEFMSVAPAIEGVDQESKRGFSWVGFGALQAVFLLLVLQASISPFRASQTAMKANAAFMTAEGYAYSQAAAAYWTPYIDEQAFLLSRNLMIVAAQGNIARVPNWKEQYALAKQLSQTEISRHPLNTNPNLLYGQLLATFASLVPEDGKLVEAQFQKAIETSPKRQQIQYNLANYYLGIGRVSEGLAIYRKVRDFDEELGEGYWNYGQLLMSIDSKSTEGIENLLRSQETSRPYRAQNVKELSQIFVVLEQAGKKDRLPALLLALSDLPAATAEMYARLAYQYERAGLTSERDQVIAFGTKIDPLTAGIYEQIKSGFLNDTGQRVITAPGTVPASTSTSILRK